MARAVTIDNYELSAHQRYAADQITLDLTLLQDAHLISQLADTSVNDSSLSSKWDELFETNLHRHPFANFAPPPRYLMARNRFFSYSISPDFDWFANRDFDQEDEQQQREEQQAQKYKKKIQAKKSNAVPEALLEKDRSALLNLVDSIQSLNSLIRDIHARKLQYQKG